MKNQKLKKEDPLYQEIESRIDKIKGKKTKYIISYRVLKVLVLLASASIAILQGFDLLEGSEFKPDNLILIISVCITLFVAVEELLSLKDKGKGYDIFLFDLRRLHDRICFDYITSPEHYAKEMKGHFDRYQEILETQKTIIENSDD